MKIRNGFVSNSSSSSFILKKEFFTDLELELIRNFINKRGDYYQTEIEEETDLYIKGDLEAHSVVKTDDPEKIVEDEYPADILFKILMLNMNKEYGKDYMIEYEDYVSFEKLTK